MSTRPIPLSTGAIVPTRMRLTAEDVSGLNRLIWDLGAIRGEDRNDALEERMPQMATYSDNTYERTVERGQKIGMKPVG